MQVGLDGSGGFYVQSIRKEGAESAKFGIKHALDEYLRIFCHKVRGAA